LRLKLHHDPDSGALPGNSIGHGHPVAYCLPFAQSALSRRRLNEAGNASKHDVTAVAQALLVAMLRHADLT
jgi:hypothetical protein